MRSRFAKVQAQERPLEQSQPQPATPIEAELHAMISEAAYYRAERRGFAPGMEADDWLQAEAEILARMRAHEQRI
jgi:hypothetical protein